MINLRWWSLAFNKIPHFKEGITRCSHFKQTPNNDHDSWMSWETELHWGSILGSTPADPGSNLRLLVLDWKVLSWYCEQMLDERVMATDQEVTGLILCREIRSVIFPPFRSATFIGFLRRWNTFDFYIIKKNAWHCSQGKENFIFIYSRTFFLFIFLYFVQC